MPTLTLVSVLSSLVWEARSEVGRPVLDPPCLFIVCFLGFEPLSPWFTNCAGLDEVSVWVFSFQLEFRVVGGDDWRKP